MTERVIRSYAQERRVFDRLRSDCSDEAREEYEDAIATLLRNYNTTIHENRFIAGGAVEVFTYALLRSVGIDCCLYGAQSRLGGILLPNDRKLSIKETFTGGPANVKLMNKQGGGHREWTTATLFVVSSVGLVYGSPDMVDGVYVKDVNDGTELKKAGLQTLIDNPANLFKAKIAQKPPTEMDGFSKKASTTVARQILSDMPSENLMKNFAYKWI